MASAALTGLSHEGAVFTLSVEAWTHNDRHVAEVGQEKSASR